MHLITFNFLSFLYIFIIEQEQTSTKQSIAVSNFDKIVKSTHHLEGKSTLTIPKFIEPNIGGILENRIQTIWQFVLIMLAVFSVLAFTYLGKCVHRQWTSRSLQVGNTMTSAPDSALNVHVHVSNQNEFIYEQIQNIEYEDPERYLTAAHDDILGDGINNSQEKIDSVSFMSIGPTLEPSNDEAINGEHESENAMYENQSSDRVRETNDLYLTPIL